MPMWGFGNRKPPDAWCAKGIMAPAVRGGNRRGVTCESCPQKNKGPLPPGSECANTVDKRLRTETYGKATNKGLTSKAGVEGVVKAKKQGATQMIMKGKELRKQQFVIR